MCTLITEFADIVYGIKVEVRTMHEIINERAIFFIRQNTKLIQTCALVEIQSLMMFC